MLQQEGCAWCKLQGCTLVAKRCTGRKRSWNHLLFIRKVRTFILKYDEEIISYTREFSLQYQYFVLVLIIFSLLEGTFVLLFSELLISMCYSACLSVCSPGHIFVAACQPTVCLYGLEERRCPRAELGEHRQLCPEEPPCLSEPAPHGTWPCCLGSADNKPTRAEACRIVSHPCLEALPRSGGEGARTGWWLWMLC